MKICINQQKMQIQVNLKFITSLLEQWNIPIQTAQKTGLCKSRDNDNLLIKRNLLWKIYSYTTVMVMCPKQQQNANWSQVEIENLIVRGRNLPRTNCTKFETQNIFAKISKTNTAQNLALPCFFKRKWMFIMYIY